MIVLLENIRSTENVGSIFRTADAVGAEKILLVGYTPCPVDRMERENRKLAKTALGAEKTLPWKHYRTTEEALIDHGHHTHIVVEQTEQAVLYTELHNIQNPLYIFGNEVNGVEESTRKHSGQHIYLPMRGTKESLNVAVCAGIILYHTAQK